MVHTDNQHARKFEQFLQYQNNLQHVKLQFVEKRTMLLPEGKKSPTQEKKETEVETDTVAH